MASRKLCSPQFYSRRATVPGRQGIETGVYTLADFPVGDRRPELGPRRPDRPRAALPLSRPLVIPGVRGPLFARESIVSERRVASPFIASIGQRQIWEQGARVGGPGAPPVLGPVINVAAH